MNSSSEIYKCLYEILQSKCLFGYFNDAFLMKISMSMMNKRCDDSPIDQNETFGH